MTTAIPALPRTTATQSTRVASIPGSHPYVQRISTDPDLAVLPDPPVPGAPSGVWWPPVMLDPSWIDEHAGDADVLHIHFGTESFPPGHLSACIAAAKTAGWVVVVTVHDLDHPQLADQTAYRAQLDELVPAADAVVTLTSGAAGEVRRRWHRDALVIPHPSLLDGPPPVVGAHRDLRIGTHLKDLRPGTDGPATVFALVGAIDRLRDAGLPAVADIRMHRSVRDDAAAQAVRDLSQHEHVRLAIEGRRSDADLAALLSGWDVCVLPYRHGTHSGWLELCWDLGIAVAAPTIGQFLDQHHDRSIAGFAPGDAASLAAAVALLGAHPRAGTPERAVLVDDRRLERQATDAAAAACHADLYRRLRRERAS